MLGDLLELSCLLTRRYHSKEMAEAELAEQQHVTRMWIVFKREFSRRQLLLIDGQLHDPQRALFNPSVVDLAAKLVQYKEVLDIDRAFTLKKLRTGLLAHFKKYHPSLLEMLQKRLYAPDPSAVGLLYTGPSFTVVNREEAMAVDPIVVTAGKVPVASN